MTVPGHSQDGTGQEPRELPGRSPSLYNVHVYRELRLRFDGIKAASQEQAAQIAADLSLADAAECAECDGRIFAALVDVVGDDEYGQSRVIDLPDGLLLSTAAATAVERDRLKTEIAELVEALKNARDDLARIHANQSGISEEELTDIARPDSNVIDAATAVLCLHRPGPPPTRRLTRCHPCGTLRGHGIAMSRTDRSMWWWRTRRTSAFAAPSSSRSTPDWPQITQNCSPSVPT